MSNPENEKTSQINESFHPGQQPDPRKSAINSPPPMYGTSSSMPYQYHVSAGPPGAISMQPQQTIPITNIQSTQGANQLGDIASAKRYSRLALTLGHRSFALVIISVALFILLEDVSKARGVRIEKCMQGKREKNQQDLWEHLRKK
ncbi:hypothetical protein E2320_000581 [Naja naja]|nr:hypothetical protein E2320_000581 [Naja naja]